VANVLVKEDLPDMVWSVHVDGEIIATFMNADEGVITWYPSHSNEPEYLDVNTASARIKSYGDVTWAEFK